MWLFVYLPVGVFACFRCLWLILFALWLLFGLCLLVNSVVVAQSFVLKSDGFDWLLCLLVVFICSSWIGLRL